ncbi:alpha/beta hydrolase [bacterium]|nr:alpha/beta hydrolase [bacterium]
MKKKSLSFLLFTLLSLGTIYAQSSNQTLDTSPYFNTKFLRNYDLVKEILIKQEGFKPIQFPASDDVLLDGLLLTRKNARATIIFCAGFFPGRKEGQAPIFKMLPPEYNILFFDARGHADSQGHFWSTLNNYGKNEYKDVLGAISLIEKIIGGDIILYGVCSGAFHASHALIKKTQKKESPVAGFIFDSGFASSITVSDALTFHIKEKIMPNMLNWYASKKTVKSTYLYKLSSWAMTTLVKTIKNLFLMPGIKRIESETNLLDKMHTIKCPVFFIHCKNDNYSPFDNIFQIASTVQNKIFWWIENSSHALHPIKHKYEYQERLIDFLDSVLN